MNLILAILFLFVATRIGVVLEKLGIFNTTGDMYGHGVFIGYTIYSIFICEGIK